MGVGGIVLGSFPLCGIIYNSRNQRKIFLIKSKVLQFSLNLTIQYYLWIGTLKIDGGYGRSLGFT